MPTEQPWVILIPSKQRAPLHRQAPNANNPLPTEFILEIFSTIELISSARHPVALEPEQVP